MKKNKKIYQDILLYAFLFMLFLGWNLLLMPVCWDEVWNYGFAHNLYSGLVPYRDFNMIITPLFPFLMSLPFYMFGSNMLVFHITNALILTLASYLLVKLFNDKGLLVVAFLFIFFQVSFPSYNVFLFFLLILLIYLEKKRASDYLIGLVLCLIFLTKQSVGFCFLLVGLYLSHGKKSFLKRGLVFLGGCLIFLIYLLVSGSFQSFLDLGVFGLFSFAKGNGQNFNIYYLYLLIMLSFNIYFIFRDHKNISSCYGIAFYSIMVPLFDRYHFSLAFLAFMITILENFKFLDRMFRYRLLSLGLIVGIFLVVGIKRFDSNIIYPNNIKHFEYRLMDNYTIKVTKEMEQFVKKHKDQNIVFLNSNAYYFKIVNDLKIDYLDMINTGNWGYNGDRKLLDRVKGLRNTLFVVSTSELNEVYQTDKAVLRYVLDNGEKVSEVLGFDIYKID